MTEPIPGPTPPDLSRQARLEGQRKSLEIRRERAKFKLLLSSASPILRPALLECALDPDNVNHPAQGMKVRQLLLALPYVGPKKADEMLDRAGIPRDNTVRACGPKQRERLFALLAER